MSRRRWAEVLARHAQSNPELLLRRQAQRGLVEFGVAVISYDGDWGPVTQTLPVLNLSPGGLMLKSQRPLAVDTRLQLEVVLGNEKHRLTGRVAHCTQTVGGFKIGIQLFLPSEPKLPRPDPFRRPAR